MVTTVKAVYFSPTGTTRTLVTSVATQVAKQCNSSYQHFDFTLPQSRRSALEFTADDLVIFGTPVYAGRVPNILLDFLNTIKGNGALAVPLVAYGNRHYDDALIELRDLLVTAGCRILAAAAFIGEHSFSTTLAKGRPDALDLEQARQFALQLASLAKKPLQAELNAVPGTPKPYRGYYQPRDRAGNPVDIRKVKPLTNDDCTDCKLCVAACPMGSINYEHVSTVNGVCIKCGACIKICPYAAKYYDDAAYLYHKRELEEDLQRRAEPELFLPV